MKLLLASPSGLPADTSGVRTSNPITELVRYSIAFDDTDADPTQDDFTDSVSIMRVRACTSATIPRRRPRQAMARSYTPQGATSASWTPAVMSPSSLPEGPSEEMAWSFWSQRTELGPSGTTTSTINADMTRALRVLENLSGEKLVFIDKDGVNQSTPTPRNLIGELNLKLEDLATRHWKTRTAPSAAASSLLSSPASPNGSPTPEMASKTSSQALETSAA